MIILVEIEELFGIILFHQFPEMCVQILQKSQVAKSTDFLSIRHPERRCLAVKVVQVGVKWV